MSGYAREDKSSTWVVPCSATAQDKSWTEQCPAAPGHGRDEQTAYFFPDPFPETREDFAGALILEDARFFKGEDFVTVFAEGRAAFFAAG